MNKPVTELIKVLRPTPDGDELLDRRFSVFFIPDPTHEDWAVCMMYTVISVNRQTGEVCFELKA